MNYNKTFKIFNLIYHVSIKSESSNNKIFNDITDCLLEKKKLLATKMIKDNFEITLIDAKKIVDNIIEVKTNGGSNYHYVFKINKRKNILKYLKKTLGTYGRSQESGIKYV